jgi:AcrR family transcriptional regulator
MPDPLTQLEAMPSPKTQEILQAARGVFIAKGFEAASMDAVAKAAGVPRPRSMPISRAERLFAAIVAQVAGRLTGEIRAIMEPTCRCARR